MSGPARRSLAEDRRGGSHSLSVVGGEHEELARQHKRATSSEPGTVIKNDARLQASPELICRRTFHAWPAICLDHNDQAQRSTGEHCFGNDVDAAIALACLAGNVRMQLGQLRNSSPECFSSLLRPLLHARCFDSCRYASGHRYQEGIQVDDRRVLNGASWRLRTGLSTPWEIPRMSNSPAGRAFSPVALSWPRQRAAMSRIWPCEPHRAAASLNHHVSMGRRQPIRHSCGKSANP